MTINSENNYVLIGLPHSGKSTFIAALWYIVESGDLLDSLIITVLPEERAYLNKLRDTWLSFKDFERTKVNKHHITLTCSSHSNDIVSELKFPDVSGEMYKFQFENRELDLEYLKLIQSANGIFLFINPDHLIEPLLISDIDACVGKTASKAKGDKPKEWEFKDVPTQVVLVDLLQMILFNIDHPLKVTVVISAWDMIVVQKIKPSQWLEKNLPLLFQFLKANDSLLKYSIFGISAQGGKYSNEILELQTKPPSERIIVQTDLDKSNDITLPIKWLLSNE